MRSTTHPAAGTQRQSCAGSLRPRCAPLPRRRPGYVAAPLQQERCDPQPGPSSTGASSSALRALPLWDMAVSAASSVSSAASTTAFAIPGVADPVTWGMLAGLGVALYAIKRVFDTPSRTYSQNVGQEYDAWTQEGILEYYWGEHIHLGYYNDEERRRGAFKKDFKKAKFDFVDEMLRFSGAQQPKRILDVGCGFGGTSRYLAKMFPDAQVEGITLSPEQVKRGTELAKEQGVTNVKFQVMDALQMTLPDDQYDLVWACESGEHMPDKKRYVEEMTRVLKPGGKIVIACWCQREETPERPLTQKDKSDLQFLYDEWAHPYFISIEEFVRLMNGTGKLEAVGSADWTPQTIDSWLHSIWVGVLDPWIVVFKGPVIWYKVMREIVTLARMHLAFAKGLMQYGMMHGTKAASSKPAAAQETRTMVGAKA